MYILAAMNPAAKLVQRTYLRLILLSTLAASFIWGVNTLFLLDAGLSNTEAFAANAFFTVGQVLFEIPTGVVADVHGRRISYLLGAGTLLLTTLAYLWLWQIEGPFWAWAVVSALLGLGFTFFSGATEAWLVDALNFTKFKGDLDGVFARGQAIGGAAMLTGSVLGGIVAQFTNLGVPYLIRSALLGLTLLTAARMMFDLGFTPDKTVTPSRQVRRVLKASIDNGLKKPPVRYVMLAAPFAGGVGIYIFYAMQPYLLELYGDPSAYSVAGLAAAIVAGAQIVGSMLVKQVRGLFRYRTGLLLTSAGLSAALIGLAGFIQNFWVVIIILVGWGLVFALTTPVRQAYLNGLIDSKQRATVLSFDSLMSSSGGAVSQPVLGRVADVSGYAASYVVASAFQLVSLPFLLLARRQKAPSDPIA